MQQSHSISGRAHIFVDVHRQSRLSQFLNQLHFHPLTLPSSRHDVFTHHIRTSVKARFQKLPKSLRHFLVINLQIQEKDQYRKNQNCKCNSSKFKQQKFSNIHDVPQVIIIPVRNYIILPMVGKIAQSISGLGLPCSDAAAEKKLKSLILGLIRLHLRQHRRKRNGEQKGEICCLLAD